MLTKLISYLAALELQNLLSTIGHHLGPVTSKKVSSPTLEMSTGATLYKSAFLLDSFSDSNDKPATVGGGGTMFIF